MRCLHGSCLALAVSVGAQSEAAAVDDCIRPGDCDYHFPGDNGVGNQFELRLSRFEATECRWIDRITARFVASYPDEDVYLYLYDDPDGDGDPNDGTLLIPPVVVPFRSNFIDVQLDEAVEVDGFFFVGVLVTRSTVTQHFMIELAADGDGGDAWGYNWIFLPPAPPGYYDDPVNFEKITQPVIPSSAKRFKIACHSLEPPDCPADTNCSFEVDVVDLVHVVLDWDTDGAEHGSDVDGSGLVDVDDLNAVIVGWGPCP